MFSAFTNTDHNLLSGDIYTKKWTKMITFLIAYYWECYQLFYGNKIDILAFRGHVYVSKERFIFCDIYTWLSKDTYLPFRKHAHLVQNSKSIFFPCVKSDIWIGWYLLSKDYLHIRENSNVSFPLACWLQG